MANSTQWSVTLGGLVLGSTSPDVAFEVQNGTYPFTVGSVPGYGVAPKNGNVSVAGEDVGVAVTFVPTEYPVVFTEHGLPVGRSWTVWLDGAPMRSTTSAVALNASNGTHSYLVTGPAGFRVGGLAPLGELTVAGGPVAVPLTFARGATFALVFSERGLPRSTTWCVVVGTLGCSSTPVLRFVNLTPATYGYDVVPMAGQVITAMLGPTSLPLAGNVTISGHSLRIGLRFVYPYNVTFAQSGLSSGSWSITVRGHTQTALWNQSIVFSLPNGTYGFRIGPEIGFTSTHSPARVAVAGAAASAFVTFTPRA